MKQMSDSSREKFEEFMAERFEHCIDRRRCKNGDGNDYMSWDMNVARIVWQHLSQRAEAAEASAKDWRNKAMNQRAKREVAESKLAELEKQEAAEYQYYYHNHGTGAGQWLPVTNKQAYERMKAKHAGDNDFSFRELYTRTAPTINLAELVPEQSLNGQTPFLGDKEPYYNRGWNDCRVAILRNIEGAQ